MSSQLSFCRTFSSSPLSVTLRFARCRERKQNGKRYGKGLYRRFMLPAYGWLSAVDNMRTRRNICIYCCPALLSFTGQQYKWLKSKKILYERWKSDQADTFWKKYLLIYRTPLKFKCWKTTTIRSSSSSTSTVIIDGRRKFHPRGQPAAFLYSAVAQGSTVRRCCSSSTRNRMRTPANSKA